jgi:beta-glucanase (GH16 family)
MRLSRPKLMLPFLFLACATVGLRAQERPGWKLVWRDEFNDDRLDTSKWSVLVREQSKHHELQYYLPDEVYVQNGCLHLRSRTRDYGGMHHYTSGRLSTDGKFAPVYGRFEIRARLPYGKGLWPAIWLYPQNRDWIMEQVMAKAVQEGHESTIPEERPWYSEIDILEYLGHETNVVYATLHYSTFAGELKRSSATWKASVDLSKDFHVYALEWEPNEIRWYVDDNLIHSTRIGIPHKPHYIILNTAVGGDWPGNPDATTTFPQLFDIDYVRVYQRDHYFGR